VLNDIFRKSAVFSNQLLQVKLKARAHILTGERMFEADEFFCRLAGANSPALAEEQLQTKFFPTPG